MFRSEAIHHCEDGLSGNILLVIPVSWRRIGFLLFYGTITALVFLSFANYSRIESVFGKIVPSEGVSQIEPTRSGIITALAAYDGQVVPAGMQIATVRTEEDSAGGVPATAQIEKAISLQDASIAAQISAGNAAATAQIDQLGAQRTGLSAEISQIQSQVALQRDLIDSAQKDFDRARTVAERGFISQRDLQIREETLLSRQQGLSQLTQSLASKQASLSVAQRNAIQLSAQARGQSANLAATRAEVAQQAASTAGSRSYVLRAPVAGRVTALTARVGQPANPQVPLMTIVPAGAVLRAELAIPTSAIGFIKPGQEVRLAVDAFPYQRFGTITARVLTVATSPINQPGPNGTAIPVYPVTAKLDQAYVTAFGRKEPLVSGMTLTARIVTEKQSLLQWLFEPLYAVQRR